MRVAVAIRLGRCRLTVNSFGSLRGWRLPLPSCRPTITSARIAQPVSLFPSKPLQKWYFLALFFVSECAEPYE